MANDKNTNRPKDSNENNDRKDRKEKNNRDKSRRRRKKRHTEISKAMREDLKKKVDKDLHKKDLPDEFVEGQDEIVEEENAVKEKVEEGFEEEKKEVLQGGRKEEEAIKREKKPDEVSDEEEFFDFDDLIVENEKLAENKGKVDEKVDDNVHKNKKGKGRPKKKDAKNHDRGASGGKREEKGQGVKADQPNRPEVEPKKKSYLEILQEEAKKFEEMEAKRKESEKAVEDKGGEVSESGDSDEWLDFLNGADVPPEPADGVLADAAQRNQAQQQPETGTIEPDIFGEQSPVQPEGPAGVPAQNTSKSNETGGGVSFSQPSATKKAEGFHDGSRDDLFATEKGVDMGSGLSHEAELFGGGDVGLEKASEDVAGEESKVIGQPGEVVSEHNSEKVLDDAVSHGKAQINDVLEEPKAKGKKFKGAGFMDELKAALGDAGVSFGAVKGFCAVGLIVVILGVGFAFDWHKKIWNGIGGLVGMVTDRGSESGGELVVDTDWMTQASEIAGADLLGGPPLPYAVDAGIYFGDPVPFGKLPRHMGVTTGLIIGETTNVAENQRFAYMIEVAGQLRNFYNTDLREFLDNEQDRAGALDDYYNRLVELRAVGGDLQNEINERVSDIEVQFEVITKEKKAKEDEYFNYLKEFDGVNADLALEEFTALRVEQETLRTEFNALKNLSDDYEVILKRVDARLESIIANRSALIQGVTVTPVEGDNLELIEVK